MSLLSAASGWWAGHISAALIQSQIVDPINGFTDDLTDGGWTRFDSPTNLIASGYTTNGGGAEFQYHPAYKINGNGTVRLRGGIKKNSTFFPSGSTTLIPVLPSAIVPANNVEVSVAMDNNGGFVTGRIEIDDTGKLSILLESSRGNWVSLDNIQYDVA